MTIDLLPDEQNFVSRFAPKPLVNATIFDRIAEIERIAGKANKTIKAGRRARRTAVPLVYRVYLETLADQALLKEACEKLKIPRVGAPEKHLNGLLKRLLGISRSYASKLASALELARSHQIDPQDLSDFIKSQGGFDACRQKFRAQAGKQTPAPIEKIQVYLMAAVERRLEKAQGAGSISAVVLKGLFLDWNELVIDEVEIKFRSRKPR